MVGAVAVEELRQSRLGEHAGHPAGELWPARDTQHRKADVPDGRAAVALAPSPIHDATIVLLVVAAELTWIGTLAYGIWLLI